jgi:pimeloyl-ACP methyl ester carboxylesterase
MFSIIRKGLTGFTKLLVGAAILVLLILLVSILRAKFTEIRDVQEAAPQGAKWVWAHDTQMHYQTYGDRTKPVLVLVHGTGAWAGTWVSNVDALVAAGWYVVALDLPPFGYSQRFDGMDFSRPRQAKRLLSAIQNLEIDRVTLLGHSYGGGPAAEAVMMDASRIARLILVDAAIGLKESDTQLCDHSVVQQLAAFRPLRTALVTAIGTNPWMSQSLLRQFVARKEVVNTERTRIYQQPFETRDFSASLGDWAYEFGFNCAAAVSQIPANYMQLQVPMILIWGSEDTITPLTQASRLKELQKKSHLWVLNGVGHIPQIENPTQFNTTLVKALKN